MTNLFTDLPIEEQFKLEALFRQCGITPEEKKLIELIGTAKPIVVDALKGYTEKELHSICIQFASKYFAMGEVGSSGKDKEIFGCLHKLCLYGKEPGFSLANGIFKSIVLICKENGVDFENTPSRTSPERQELIQNMTVKNRANYDLICADLDLPE